MPIVVTTKGHNLYTRYTLFTRIPTIAYTSLLSVFFEFLKRASSLNAWVLGEVTIDRYESYTSICTINILPHFMLLKKLPLKNSLNIFHNFSFFVWYLNIYQDCMDLFLICLLVNIYRGNIFIYIGHSFFQLLAAYFHLNAHIPFTSKYLSSFTKFVMTKGHNYYIHCV